MTHSQEKVTALPEREARYDLEDTGTGYMSRLEMVREDDYGDWVSHETYVAAAHDHALTEQRARDAERERDALLDEMYDRLRDGTAHLIICNGDHRIPLWDVKPDVLCNCPIGNAFKQMHRDLFALHTQVAALTAERDALVPLVRLAGLVLESVQQGQPLAAFDVEFAAEHYGVDLTAARAILGRVP